MINDDDLHALSLARATWLAADRRAVQAQEAYLGGAQIPLRALSVG